MRGICPKCSKVMHQGVIEAIDLKQGAHTTWKGISISCPWCNTVISMSIDPLAIKADTVNEIKKAIR